MTMSAKVQKVTEPDTKTKDKRQEDNVSTGRGDSGAIVDMEDIEDEDLSEDVPLPPMPQSRSTSGASSWGEELPKDARRSVASTPRSGSRAGNTPTKKISTPEEVRIFNEIARQKRLSIIESMQSQVHTLQDNEFKDYIKKKEEKKIEDERKERERHVRHRNLAIRGYLPGVKDSVGWKLVKNLEHNRQEEKQMSKVLLDLMLKNYRRDTANGSLSEKSRSGSTGRVTDSETVKNDEAIASPSSNKSGSNERLSSAASRKNKVTSGEAVKESDTKEEIPSSHNSANSKLKQSENVSHK